MCIIFTHLSDLCYPRSNCSHFKPHVHYKHITLENVWNSTFFLLITSSLFDKLVFYGIWFKIEALLKFPKLTAANVRGPLRCEGCAVKCGPYIAKCFQNYKSFVCVAVLLSDFYFPLHNSISLPYS